MFKLVNIPIDTLNVKEDFASGSAGAFACFEGWVRNEHQGKTVIALEYEAIEVLCRSEAQKILNEAKEKFGAITVKCVHRIGKLEIGEIAIWIGVTAAHRNSAFKACQYIIDQIKLRLPIWKKEYYADGASQWVNCAQAQTPSISDATSWQEQKL